MNMGIILIALSHHFWLSQIAYNIYRPLSRTYQQTGKTFASPKPDNKMLCPLSGCRQMATTTIIISMGGRRGWKKYGWKCGPWQIPNASRMEERENEKWGGEDVHRLDLFLYIVHGWRAHDLLISPVLSESTQQCLSRHSISPPLSHSFSFFFSFSSLALWFAQFIHHAGWNNMFRVPKRTNV